MNPQTQTTKLNRSREDHESSEMLRIHPSAHFEHGDGCIFYRAFRAFSDLLFYVTGATIRVLRCFHCG